MQQVSIVKTQGCLVGCVQQVIPCIALHSYLVSANTFVEYFPTPMLAKQGSRLKFILRIQDYPSHWDLGSIVHCFPGATRLCPKSMQLPGASMITHRPSKTWKNHNCLELPMECWSLSTIETAVVLPIHCCRVHHSYSLLGSHIDSIRSVETTSQPCGLGKPRAFEQDGIILHQQAPQQLTPLENGLTRGDPKNINTQRGTVH